MTEVESPARAPVPVWPIVTLLAILGAIISSVTVHVPYVEIAPGSTLDVPHLVSIQGAPTYRPTGTISMVTVSIEDTTIFDAIRGWLDPAVDVVDRDKIFPPSQSRDQVRRQNLDDMATSKETALAVAFTQLGYKVVSGSGAQVVEVVKRSAADGLIHVGDVITAVDDQPVQLQTDAVRMLGDRRPGDTVTLTVQPKAGGPVERVTATLGANPDKPKKPLLGVSLATKDLDLQFPFKVDIASERIGGPSAGLAFTLAVLDLLTKGELTGGHKVAATGEIQLDGSVTQIGGVPQKTEAVKAAGAELFLVPAEEVAQARAHAGKHLRVAPVRSIDDALRILASFGGNGLALEGPARDGA